MRAARSWHDCLSMTRRHWWSAQPGRTDTLTLSAGRAYGEVLLVFGMFFAASVALAGFSLAVPLSNGSVGGWSESIPASIDQVATTILCVLVPVLLVRRRGLGAADLGLSRPGTVGISRGIRMATWGLLALIAGSLVTGALATGKFNEGRFSYADLTVNLFHAAQAGPLEEVVVLAFTVITLEQARRPRPEIVAVAVILRMSYHIYYGPGVLGILIWSTVFLWLFLRFRTIIPLIILHSAWDLWITVADHWHWVILLDFLAWVTLFITAPILWLTARHQAPQPAANQMLAWPGWYPDPGGGGGTRWFDGWHWAPDAHGPGRT